MNNNLMVSIDLWPKIFKTIEEPQIVRVCKLFKEICENAENTYVWLSQKPCFKALFLINEQSLQDKLKLAKTELITRWISSRPQSTLDKVKNTPILPLQGFIRLIKEENALNLVSIFEKIPLEKKPSLTHLNLLKRAEKIGLFLKKNQDSISSIEELDLKNLGLTEVPEELQLFIGLKKIDLSFNLVRELPSHFGKEWKHLKVFSCKNNKLTSLPKDFGNCWSELITLDLNFNQLEKLPDDFGIAWKNLEELNIDSNQLKTLPESYKTWEKLNFLRMKKNPLSNDIIEEVQKNLKKLLFLS